MKKILLCTLFFIFALGFVPTSAYDVPSEYQTYIDNINGSGFWWKEYSNSSFVTNGVTYYTLISYPPNLSSWILTDVNRNIPTNGSYLSDVSAVPIISLNILSNNGVYYLDTTVSVSDYCFYGNYPGRLYPNYYGIIQDGTFDAYNYISSPYSNHYSSSGTLAQVLEYIQYKFRNVNIYVDGSPWSIVDGSYSIETEIELPCDIQAVDSSFNFFNGGYGITWKQGQYNWTQTGPLENVTRTLVWSCQYPTREYVTTLFNQQFGNSSPLETVRNAFNTVFNSGTSIYDIPEQYRASTNFFLNIDSPELDGTYNISYDSSTQQWSLNHREYEFSVLTGYTFNLGFFRMLYNYYGDPDLFSIALCYITPTRVSMYAVDDTQDIIYNPLSIYWLDIKQSNGTVLEYRNFGNTTTVTDDNITDDTTNNDSVIDDGIPFVEPTEEQLNTNYNNSIQDSYNHTVNNYYNYNQINTDLLDYYLSFRDGGTEQDVQDAFGYLNSTISSLSNVPVLLHNLFYNFFPLPVVRLMQALFIVFMVFMIIIIIKHLFR